MKIKKWLDIPELRKYERFITSWHYLIKAVQEEIKTLGDEAQIKQRNMQLLQTYFLTPYNGKDDFYEQFYARRK